MLRVTCQQCSYQYIGYIFIYNVFTGYNLIVSCQNLTIRETSLLSFFFNEELKLRLRKE